MTIKCLSLIWQGIKRSILTGIVFFREMRRESLVVLNKIWRRLAGAKEETRPQQDDENAALTTPV